MADEITRDAFEAQIIRKAWEDESFKERLIADPTATIEQECGRKLAEGVEVVVIDESQGKFGLVVPSPPPPPQSKTELGDEELEAVAGGLYAGLGSISLGAWRNQMTLPFNFGKRAYADVWRTKASAYVDTWGDLG